MNATALLDPAAARAVKSRRERDRFAACTLCRADLRGPSRAFRQARFGTARHGRACLRLPSRPDYGNISVLSGAVQVPGCAAASARASRLAAQRVEGERGEAGNDEASRA